MPLLTLDGASLAFGDAPLLDRADLTLDAGERVALIGRNGSGKTTLLKVIAGRQALDDGTLWRAPGLRVSFVEQEPPLEAAQSVYEAVAAGFGELRQSLLEYHRLSHALVPGNDPADLDR